MRLIKVLIITLLITYLFHPAYAQENPPFLTNYNVEYSIDKTGETQINQKVSILNLEKDVVATNYTLSIRKMNIFDLKADASRGDIEIKEDKSGDTIDVDLTFEETVIGEGQSNDFEINYKSYDIASKTGEVWNINVPKVNLLASTKEYNVQLKVPKDFGPEIFVSPKPLLKEDSENYIIYNFNKNTLEKNGITASFGQYQVLNFRLDYDLVNDSRFDAKKTITLPPDIKDMQQIAYKSIDPKPDRISHDKDGNTVAEYMLEGKEIKHITAIGTARILSRQIIPEFGGKKEQIPENLIRLYTNSSEFWNTDNTEIKKIAEEIYDPKKTVSENAQAAYLYTTNNLQYDFDILAQEQVTRKGGAGALSSKNNIGCMEFTDLFISLTRAMGIPSRELNGYAIANEDSSNTPLSINLKGGDLLHAWAEIYDPEYGWIPIDPTWGSTSGIDYFTKLDTNHLALAIKGISPYYPLPAGTLKSKTQDKYVNVDFASDINEQDFTPKLKLYKATDFNPLNLIREDKKFYLRNEGYIAAIYEGNKILPGEYISILLPNTELKIEVEDTLGKSYALDLEIGSENLENKTEIITFVSLLGLALCGISYLVIRHLQNLRKGLYHLNHRLQDRDQ